MKLTRLFICSLAMTGLMYGCGGDSEEESGAPVPENTAALCSDGQDNDGNGKKDCDEDSCAKFDNCKSSTGDKECTSTMPSGKTCTCDKTTGEWTDCQDNHGGEGDKECTSAMPSGKTCTCDKTTGEWTDCQDNHSGEGDKECTSAMPSGKTCTCDKTTGEWTDCQDNGGGDKECTSAMPSGKTCTCDKTTGEWKDCTDIAVDDTDKNNNHLKDSKETATLSASQNCFKNSECSSGFCDSFIHKCSMRCSDNSDCMNGYICRADGRCAAEAFETVWHISAANEELSMPLNTGVCDYTIDWGDGSAPEEVKTCPTDLGALKHKYTTAGDYHVKITGTYKGWCMADGHIGATCIKAGDELKLIEVVSYGPVGLGSNAFASAKNLKKLSTVDIPDATLLGCGNKGTENCGELWDVFYNCENLESGVSKWDVSQVKEIHNMFAYAKKYDEALSQWDTSNITTMEGMFISAEKFNGTIGSWDTGKVSNMRSMFEGAKSFNQDISGWHTGSVKNMNSMFKEAIKFNQNIGDWDMHSITDMADMFNGATAFNYVFSPSSQSHAASGIQTCNQVKSSFEGTSSSCDALSTMRKGAFFTNLISSCTVTDLKSTCSN